MSAASFAAKWMMPKTVLAGFGAWTLLRWLPGWMPKALAAVLLAAGLAHLGWECYQLNFNVRLYADQRNPYVYAHTSTDVLNLAQQLERLAEVSPEGHDLVIHVVTPDNYWPLPWYLRSYKRVGWWVHVPDSPDADIIFAAPELYETLQPLLKGKYLVEFHGLRPGVLLHAYIRQDLWDSFMAAQTGAQTPS